MSALAMLSGSASAAQTWRLSTDQQIDSPEGKAYQKFADLVDKYSNGELKIQLFPYSQLGTDSAVLEQMSAGLVQVFPDALSDAQKWVPDIQYMSAPFLFANRAQWVRFMQSDLVKGWKDQIKQKAGVEIIGDPTLFMRGPYRVLVSTKPVNSLADVSNLKLRLAKDQLSVDAWLSLGASVQVMDWSAVYDSLDRHMIDAMTSPIAQLESIKVTEVAKHVQRTNEYWQSVAFFVNAKAYDGLSPADKAAVDRAYIETARYVNEIETSYTVESIARMKKSGVQFTDLDTGPFVKKMQSFYEARSKAGKLPNGFLDAVQQSAH
ncbi:MAG: TRAP transporter substrate-binding protein [Janthinobacterium lividum]